MTDRNRIKHRLRQRARRQRLVKLRNGRRRGVLLLVVLSMLVLFMLVGTTFLLTSKQGLEAAKNEGRLHQYENQPSDLMDRAVKQIVRDTQNPFSVVRGNSLLLDQYGTDGFVMPASTNPVFVTAEYSGSDATLPQGLTKGQLIDVYVAPIANTAPPAIKLVRDAAGEPVPYSLSQTIGYYNGGLLTFLSGQAAGKTVRIVDFVFDTSDPANVHWRFRVMNCSRGDGSPLYLPPLEANLVGDLTGVSFLVNGRPFNGTGVGYNPQAQLGGPRLSALEVFPATGIGAELALLPNAVYFNPATASYLDPSVIPSPDPFTGQPPATFLPLNTALSAGYPNFAGLGDADESYDAPDFQNMFLAWLSATPRAQGQVMDLTVNPPQIYDIDDPRAQTLYRMCGATSVATEADLLYLPMIDDVPFPSFHRPDLAYFWIRRLFAAQWLSSIPGDQRTAAIFDANTITGPESAQIAAIKRRFLMRPLPEDHPNFDGSNPKSRYNFSGGQVVTAPWEVVGPWDVDNDNDGIPESIWIDLGDPIQETDDGKLYRPLYAFYIIDLDSRLNLNAHGTSEHLVNVPLDNVFVQTNQQSGNLAGGAGNPLVSSNNLAPGSGWGPADISLRPVLSRNLPAAVIGDRRTDDYARLLTGRPNLQLDINWSPIADTYSTWGRHGGGDISGVPNIRSGVPLDIVPSNDPLTSRNRFLATRDPLTSYDFYDYPIFDASWAQRTIAALPPANFNRIYLEWAIQAHRPTSYGISPDLRARYAVGLDYTGQPVYESSYEPTFATIVDDSPYELNLTDEFRNDSVADPLSMVASYSTTSPINDDAPFSIAELERILRANDADMGGVPDRLWNLVDAFDPVKLAATPWYLINFSDPTARLAQAQIETSINRRLVTTDSSHVPVPTGNMYTRCLLGADGKPGKAGIDDNQNGIIDDALEIGWADGDFNTFLIDPSDPDSDSDDFGSVFRHLKDANGVYLTAATALPVHGAGLVDYLRYRIVLELFNKNAISNGNNNNTVVDADLLANPIIAQLMPPDVMAGLKMDLNRPFGDGRDNNGNGVVDEPLEAGEPFVDMNGNRRWDGGEPYLDLDGDGRFYADVDGNGQLQGGNPALDNNDDWADFDGNGIEEPVVDNLWAQQLGSPVPFTYHPGMRGVFVFNGNNVVGELINPYDTVRQLYARHLYVLARLTMDENYVAPYDEDNLQLRTWMDELKKELTMADPALTPQDAELIVRKKLTYREVAQWAINCADMRDADVIMTPFEYDENPWDGWNSFDYQNNVAIPLDGDLRTDEDLAYVQTVSGNLIDAPQPLPSGELLATEKTRGVVWGAERPELLITETLAFHDRRTEDLLSLNQDGHGQLTNVRNNPDKWIDETLDQRMRPRGSVFVEFYNPQSDDGQKPAELYSINPRDDQGIVSGPPVASPGVEMGRLSDGFVRVNNVDKRSPVWRLIVVEEHPEYRNDDRADDARPDVRVGADTVDPPANAVFRYSDPDFPGFDYSRMPKWVRAAPSDITHTYPNATKPPETRDYSRNIFEVNYPYVEREFYFTVGGSRAVRTDVYSQYKYTSSRYDVATPPVGTQPEFRLHIPDRSIGYRLDGATRIAQTQKFLHPDAEQGVNDWNDPADPNWKWQIAPILPGSYGVVGSAGARYTDPQQTPEFDDSFVTALGWPLSQKENTPLPLFRPMQTRRIELRVGRHLLPGLRSRIYNPNPAQNPNQVYVVRNGGKTTVVRDNELLSSNTVDGQFGPAVGIPVEGMSISEPAWEYQAREFEIGIEMDNNPLKFNRTLGKGEGMYARGAGFNPTTPDSYDLPFDDAQELVRNGTTFNYRMIHLQRLANPLLPWNPAPGEFMRGNRNNPNGQPVVDAHDPARPINPYRTIDSSSVDLTAFNGVSSSETVQPDTSAMKELQKRPWAIDAQELTTYQTNGQNGRQRWIFRSLERGANAALATLKGPVASSLPVRAIWQQEPAKSEFNPDYYLDLLPWVSPASPEAQERVTKYRTMLGKESRDAGYADDRVMHVDMVLEHSLGFGNEAIGDIYSTDPNPAPLQAPTPSAIGAPFIDDIDTEPMDDSTYPWLAWNNRPYSSDMELLQIPSRSSSEMLQNYTVTNPYADVDPYNGNIPAPATTPTPEEINDLRDANHHGHFGHLMNFFEAAVFPADMQRDNAGVPIVDTTAGPDSYIPLGAPHYYRLLDYVHVPSKFVGTDTMLNPRVFNRLGENLVVNQPSDPMDDDVRFPNDPRQSLLTPFNRVAKYREPGRVNINTISDARVWDGGVMQRQLVNPALPYDPINNPYAASVGHLGLPFNAYDLTGFGLGPGAPGLADVRRGYLVNGALAPLVPYGSPPNFDPMYFLDPQFPTIFANPFRAGDAGDMVPLANMVQAGGVNATMLRGTAGINPATTLPTTEVSFADQSPQSGAPHFDVSRNPYLKYAALNKAGSSVTTRSNVFAVWVTVGFFEVEPVSREIRDRYDMNDPVQRDLYNRIYPEGYMLAQEIGSDTGDIKRHRGFYIIDRSLPAGFMPGVDVNVDNLIKLRRRIE